MLEIHFEIEQCCQLNCRHCSSYPLTHSTMGKIGYTQTDMNHFLCLLKHPADIYFTGGEPLVNNHLVPMIETIRACSSVRRVGIFTSGLVRKDGELIPLSREMALQLQEAGLNNCYLSIYSHNALVHDYMTRHQGSLSKTAVSINQLVAAGVDVRFNSVIFKKNVDEIQALIQFAAKLGASEVRLLKLINHGNAISHWNSIKIDEKLFLKTVLEAKETQSPVRITVSGLPHLMPCRPFADAKKCQAGLRLLYVDFKGNIFPCACVKNDQTFLLGHISKPERVMIYLGQKKNLFRDHCLLEKGIKNEK